MSDSNSKPSPSVHEILSKEELHSFGYAELKTPMSMDLYKNWIKEGFHGDMKYLKEHIPQKEQPTALLPKAHSAIVISQPYFPAQDSNLPLEKLKVALYARQRDYHFWFQDKLNALAAKLKMQFPNEEFLCFTDSKPVLERDLAHQAGLGWVGKNTCLIHEKKGSLFFIGEIYTSLKLQTNVNIHPDRCGTCTKCLDACPTGALVEPRKLDARKCISYWTIESKAIPDEELRNQFEGWYFGCDICQVVCPWNQKFFKQELLEAFEKSDPKKEREGIVEELRMILGSSNKELERLFKESPLSRARPWAHKRNAIITAANFKLTELIEDIGKYQEHEKLGELSKVTLKLLVSKS